MIVVMLLSMQNAVLTNSTHSVVECASRSAVAISNVARHAVLDVPVSPASSNARLQGLASVRHFVRQKVSSLCN